MRATEILNALYLTLTLILYSSLLVLLLPPKMDRAENQLPAGYPAENTPNSGKKKEKKCWPQSKPKGERGFIEGCLFALCCCWVCEMCF